MNTKFALSLAAFLSALTPLLAAEPARVWQTNLVIPTYLAAPPSPVPRFYEGRTYQGAKATFYPYPVQDVLTDIKTNKTYAALFLENDYIQISVIPELGGRIFSAVDKANGYDFFYRQHVIKPALIGMLGAWISGGVEWNVPHHHRATSFSPVDFTTQTNADGSATIWVGEIELRSRMKWLVGMTLHPDRSYLELTCKVFNRTPFAHPMLFWINAAVHANTNYQVIFPPSTEWAAQHSKPEFASWPIARQNYGGTDYTRGVDISWWKNHPNPVSFFCWNYEDDWFGGYDHGKQAGVIHVADHHVAPGKKFFEWGNGPEGEMWSKILTDDDGPYLELMAGAWSDNQPDYSWIQPGETREWKHWWYPVRNMGGVKAANRDAAVNLTISNRVTRIEFNSTRPFTNVTALLGEGVFVWTEKFDIAPDKPFVREFEISRDLHPERGPLRLLAADGRELVSYDPGAEEKAKIPMPKPVEKPKSPKDYATADELFYTGQRVEQLYSPSFEARPYYEEMLRRDPGDYRANTALGILLCKQWRWDEAAKYLSNAIGRATGNHIRPADGEAFYYLGVALKARGKLDDAYEVFQKAVWNKAWGAAGFYELAGISAARGNITGAMEHVDRSLSANSRNTRAIALKVALSRRPNRRANVTDLLDTAAIIDPLDMWAAHQGAAPNLSRSYAGGMGPVPGSPELSFDLALELATDYANAGLWSVALAVADWERHTLRFSPPVPGTATIYYALGFFSERCGESGETMYRYGSEQPPGFCFPYRWEEEPVLRRAMELNPKDANAPYLLGCLLYDNQPENAIKAWEESRQRNAKFALTHRNLALGYAQHEKNIPKAIASLERAVELDPKEPRFFYELDVQYEAGGAPVAQRLAMLTNHHSVVTGRDDALTREIVLLTAAGQAERAVALLRGRHFRNWEGSSQIHSVYVDACLAHGHQLLAEMKPREALAALEAALEYPENLEVGKARRSPRTAQIQYLIGTAQEALGDAAAAKAAFEKAAASRERGANESSYFHALALQKLGRGDEAKPVFERLVKAGEEQRIKGEAADYFAKFGEKTSERVRQANAHFLIGLGHLGLGEQAKADAEFQQALESHPAHLGATMMTAK